VDSSAIVHTHILNSDFGGFEKFLYSRSEMIVVREIVGAEIVCVSSRVADP
jgi:hypothetical protein